MATKKRRGRPASGKPPSVRASVSLPPEIHRTVAALAQQRKVSMAWIMRDAAEKYVADQWPLFGKQL